ncbi:MAG: hypothetical protein WBA54_11175 [Acidaminobacteraceae bacterium]
MKIDKYEALRYLGYNNQHIDGKMHDKIDKLIKEIEKNIDGKYTYKKFEIKVLSDFIEVPGTKIKLLGSSIYEHLKDCLGVVIMSATLGVPADKIIKKKSIVSGEDGLLTDALCSAYVEAVCETCNEEIDGKLTSEGLTSTWRFSPGYGDLDLKVNSEILNELNAFRTIGLYASESHMLTPSKSVVAIIGYYKGEPKTEKTRSSCGNKSCKSCMLKGSCPLYKEDKG